MSDWLAGALVGGAIGAIPGAIALIRQVRLERHIARGARCKFCGISSNHPESYKRCERNPDGIGHTFLVGGDA